jgi:glycosyltransferase 2 family protein
VLTWGGLLVSVVFAYLAVRNTRFSEVWDGLRTSNYWWLVPAFFVLAFGLFLKAVRWRSVFSPETRPPMGPLTKALLVGYFVNAILPARAGEAARVVVLNRRTGTSLAEGGTTVVVERAYDVLGLLLLLFLAVPWLPEVTWLHAAALFALVVVLALAVVVAVLAVYGLRPVRFVLRPLVRLPLVTSETLDHAAESLGRGLVALRRPKVMAVALFWTIAAWLAIATSTWLVMKGFHLGLSLVAALLVVIATNLAQILPSSPSALGVFEAATVVALGAYGVADSDALSYALVLHALSTIPFVVVGLLLLRETLSVRRKVA